MRDGKGQWTSSSLGMLAVRLEEVKRFALAVNREIPLEVKTRLPDFQARS